MSESIYLTKIEVRNLGGIENFRAQLGQVALITGENGSGKTTLLNAVRSILEGGSDPDLIRNGCDSGEVVIELSTGHTAHKTIKPTGYELEVRSPEGGLVRAAATWLKEIAPPTSFDPVAFLESDPRDRAAFLLKTLPLTFTASEVNDAFGIPKVTGTVTLQRLNELRDGTYQERKDLNRQARDLEGMIKEMRSTLPDEDGKDWGAERDRLAAEVAAIDGQIETLTAEVNLEAEQAKRVKSEEITAKIRALEEELANYIGTVDRTAAQAIKEQTGELKNQQAALSLDLGAAREKADRQQQAAGIKQAIDQRVEALKGYTNKEIRLSNTLQAIDELKHRKLKELPIEGLDLKADSRGRPVILINGVTLDKLNRQQQLFVAIQAVSLASGKMPLIICEVAELDDDHLSELAEAAAGAGIQLVLARWLNGEPLRVMGIEEYRRQAVPV